MQIFLVVAQRQTLMVRTICRTTEFPQLLHKVDVPVCRSYGSFTSLSLRRGGFPWSRLFGRTSELHQFTSLSWCRCRFPWSRLFVGPWRFLVCLRQGDRCPCCAGRASSLCRRGGDSRLGVSTASCGMKLALGSGRALCTGTGPGCDPRHQGGEGVAGSPGLTPS